MIFSLLVHIPGGSVCACQNLLLEEHQIEIELILVALFINLTVSLKDTSKRLHSEVLGIKVLI